MGILEAILIGVVQGITEFLPISSTAHVRIVPALLGWEDPGAPFTAIIQLGSLVAIFVYFWGDLSRVFLAWLRGLRGGEAAKATDAKLGWAIFFGTLPIIVLALLFKDRIEGEWRSLSIIAWSLIGLGLLMAVAERVGAQRRKLEQIGVKDGIGVGLWQALALVPGMSRSGSTITGALFMGIERATAARFSFLLSIPSIFAAGVYSLKEHYSILLGPLAWPTIASTIAAFVSSLWAISFLMKFLQRNPVYLFVAYRVILGATILFLVHTGRLDPLAGLD